MSYRILQDGSLVFPKRGDPPKYIPEGYDRDPGDPYHFILTLPKCKFRSFISFTKPCGKVGMTYNCAKDKNVSYDNCMNCDLRQE